jgi:hypothetical protein
VSVRVTVRRRGSLEADMMADLQTKLIDLHRVVVQQSPVDTGDFRAAWTVDTNALTLDNNSDHAEALADGHSPQAQKGWIEEAAKDVFK